MPVLAAPPDQPIVAQAPVDEVGDGSQTQIVPGAKAHQVGQPGHATVVEHDLADDPGRIQPGQSRQVHCRLGMPGPHQDAAAARDQRKHVPGRADRLGPALRIDGRGDRVRAVGCRDPGRDALPGLDRLGEGRLAQAVGAVAAAAKSQLACARLGHRQADQPARAPSHERDDIGRGELGDDHKVALVLPVLAVDQHDGFATPGGVDHVLDRVDLQRSQGRAIGQHGPRAEAVTRAHGGRSRQREAIVYGAAKCVR